MSRRIQYARVARRPLNVLPNLLAKKDRRFLVRRFSAQEQADHVTDFSTGTFYAKDSKTRELEPVTTTGNIERKLFGHEVTDRAIFAFMPDGLLITSLNDKTGVSLLHRWYKHSTLTRGMPSASNGEIEIVEG